MIALGVVTLLVSTFQYQRDRRRLEQDYGVTHRSSAVQVAVLFSAAGVLALLAVLFRF
jgi:hypothetical protein